MNSQFKLCRFRWKFTDVKNRLRCRSDAIEATSSCLEKSEAYSRYLPLFDDPSVENDDVKLLLQPSKPLRTNAIQPPASSVRRNDKQKCECQPVLLAMRQILAKAALPAFRDFKACGCKNGSQPSLLLSGVFKTSRRPKPEPIQLSEPCSVACWNGTDPYTASLRSMVATEELVADGGAWCIGFRTRRTCLGTVAADQAKAERCEFTECRACRGGLSLEKKLSLVVEWLEKLEIPERRVRRKRSMSNLRSGLPSPTPSIFSFEIPE